MTGKPALPQAGRMAVEETKTVRPISVMSYNIAHGCGMDGKVDLGRIAGVIRSSGADIVALQEVDSHYSGRSGFEDQAKVLAGMLGMYYSYGPNLIEPPLFPGQPARKYGNAVVSRFPIKYAVNHAYREVEKPPEDAEPRGVLETIIDLGGMYLSLFNTHLALHEDGLRSNISELVELAGNSMFPAVITGDFNAVPEHPEIQHIRSLFRDSFDGIEQQDSLTFPSRYTDPSGAGTSEPAARIDYIFSRGIEDIGEVRVISTDASDHMPIIAKLMLPVAEADKRQPELASN